MRLAIGLATAAVCAATSAFAAPQNPATATFNVTITIVKQCTVTSPGNMNLGTAVGSTDLVATPQSLTQNFTVTCSLGTPYKIGFTGTNDLAAGSATHQMKGSGGSTSYVPYNLFDATSGAGNATALNTSTSVISDTGTGLVQTKSLKAQTVATVAVQPDTYTDTVTMSVTY